MYQYKLLTNTNTVNRRSQETPHIILNIENDIRKLI